MSSREEDAAIITKYQNTLRELLSVVIGPQKITALKIYFLIDGTADNAMGGSMGAVSREHLDKLESLIMLSVIDPEGEHVETTMSIHPPTKQ